MRRSVIVAVASAVLSVSVHSFQAGSPTDEPKLPALPANKLALTPPLGWTSGKRFAAKADDRTVREMATALASNGLKDAGYRYLVVDDGWQGTRDGSGNMAPSAGFGDPKALGEFLHQQGLAFGLAAGAEEKSCAGLEGSAGHEEADARQFAAWGVDYLKYEWCAGKPQAVPRVRAGARKMAEALRATGRAIVYNVVPRGVRTPEAWAANDGANSWRVSPELNGTWESLAGIFDLRQYLDEAVAPGRWNDLDAMQCGAGLTPTECRVEMSLRALMAAPIFLGDDVRSLSPAVREVLTDREVLAIHQDALGRAGKKLDKWQDREIWVRPLANGSYAVGLFNRGKDTAIMKFSFDSLELRYLPRVRDVWKHKSLGRPDDGVSTAVEPHSVVLLRIDR